MINCKYQGVVSLSLMFHFVTAGPDLPPGTESNRHRFRFRDSRPAIQQFGNSILPIVRGEVQNVDSIYKMHRIYRI